jgi:hypothetical protein
VLVDSQFHGVRILHWVGAKRRPWAASAWLMVPDHFLLGLSVIKHKHECEHGIHAHVTGHFNGEDNHQESDFGVFPYFQTNPNDDSKIGWSLVLAKWKPEHEDQSGTNGIVNIPKMVKQLDKALYFKTSSQSKFQIDECF